MKPSTQAQIFENPNEVMLAGAEYSDGMSDFKWSQHHPHGNWAIRTIGFVMRKAFRQGCSSITFDYQSFEKAMAEVEDDMLLVLTPTHRSFMDFIICSYLCFQHPELKIKIPYIAADLQIGGLPFLGWFLKQCYAFYLQRGKGKADPELNRKIEELVANQQTLEIFIEGTRSRSRQNLAPKRGLLRALQNTGTRCALLPIAINYDRLPEENNIMKEVKGSKKPMLSMNALLKWTRELIQGQNKIGRVHLVCGKPVIMDSDSCVYEVSHAVMAQLQDGFVTTRYHLNAFLHHNKLELDLDALVEAIQLRGGVVLDSPLATHDKTCKHTEYTYRNQWLHLFFPELKALLPKHPMIQHYIQTNRFTQTEPSAVLHKDEALIKTLFQPLEEAYDAVLKTLIQENGFPYKHAKAFVQEYPDCFMPMVEDVLSHLETQKLLVKSDTGYTLGNTWPKRANHYRTTLWGQKIPTKVAA